MGAREKTLKEVRLIHLVFCISWLLLLFVLHSIARPLDRPIEPVFVGAIALAALSSLSIGAAIRRKQLAIVAELFERNPENPAALARWRGAQILSFTFAETLTLFGVALRFLGASWNIAGAFFGAGLALLLWWAPRLELPIS